jgi:hypothetical protein
LDKPLTAKQQAADILLSMFDEFTYGDMNDQDLENLDDLIKMRYSPELPSQQAKQTGVGEQHVDGRVGAGENQR